MNLLHTCFPFKAVLLFMFTYFWEEQRTAHLVVACSLLLPLVVVSDAFPVPPSDETSRKGRAGMGVDDASMEGKEEELPLLPSSDPENSKNLPKIKLGETITFEEMGPVILNNDGTMRRIGNWDEMTKGEQEATWRRISARNEKRRKILLEKQRKEGNEEL